MAMADTTVNPHPARAAGNDTDGPAYVEVTGLAPRLAPHPPPRGGRF